MEDTSYIIPIVSLLNKNLDFLFWIRNPNCPEPHDTRWTDLKEDLTTLSYV